jgi:hypothetical protein
MSLGGCHILCIQDHARRLAAFKHLGAAGVDMIRSRYSLDVCLPQLNLFHEASSFGPKA